MSIQRSKKILIGVQEISIFLGISEATTRKMLKNNGLPAHKIDGGSWISQTDALEQWAFEICYKANKRKAVKK